MDTSIDAENTSRRQEQEALTLLLAHAATLSPLELEQVVELAIARLVVAGLFVDEEATVKRAAVTFEREARA